MQNKTRGFRPSDDVEQRLVQLRKEMEDQADDNPEIIGYHGEVPMGKVIEAIIVAYLCADFDQAEHLVTFLSKVSSDEDIPFNYE